MKVSNHHPRNHNSGISTVKHSHIENQIYYRKEPITDLMVLQIIDWKN